MRWPVLGIIFWSLPRLGSSGRLPEPARRRKISCCFCIANLVISFCLFTRTQTPAIQHCLPFALWVFFAAISGFRWLATAIKSAVWQAAAMVLFAVASLAIGLITFNDLGLPATFNTAFLPEKIFPLHLDISGIINCWQPSCSRSRAMATRSRC